MLKTPEKGPMPTAVLAAMVATYTVKGLKPVMVRLDTRPVTCCCVISVSKLVMLMT